MGFPRILSKNNKVYTKLGEFCLSGDGNHFWIVCHTCQEELQTQDHFWKHIQDEHNFLHSVKQEHRTTANFIDTDTTLMPLPLYRKVNDDEPRTPGGQDDEDSDEQKEPKDYTEMRVLETTTTEMEIKIEPSSITQTLPPPSTTQAQVEVMPTLYQIPQVPPVSAYAALVNTTTSSLPALSMSVVAAAPPQAQAVAMLTQEMPKDSNSTTASASSAMSSDDGERWYICDFEKCGLKFKYQSRLELHRSVHSKERRFACELCGASFKQSCNLSTHRKKKHFLKGVKCEPIVQQRF